MEGNIRKAHAKNSGGKHAQKSSVLFLGSAEASTLLKNRPARSKANKNTLTTWDIREPLPYDPLRNA